MSHMKVAFITPENNIKYMSHYNVLDFCKEVCYQPKYQSAFKEFSQNYHYFYPYFDFVMFKLGYMFVNPMFQQKTFITSINNYLYLDDLNSFDYQKNKEQLIQKILSQHLYPFMTSVSAETLTVQKVSLDNINECMVDSNLMGIMNKTSVIVDSSHIITANTIMNQLLLLSPTISREYYQYLNEYGFDSAVDAVNFCVQNLGFLRVITSYPSIITNKAILNEEQLNFIEMADNHGFNILSTDTPTKSLIKEYKATQNKIGRSFY